MSLKNTGNNYNIHSNILAWRIPWTEESCGLVHSVTELDMTEATWHAHTISIRATATVWRPSVWLLPGCSELIKGKRIWSRQRDAFTTTDSNGNVRQFVLRCYCTFPVLITNYDSITPAWQFICSCLCSGRLRVGPLISRFHSSERSARRLSSAGAEDGRHRRGSDNCT